MIDYITLALACILLLVSGITDLKYRKVLNVMTFPLMAAGLILSGFPLTIEGWTRAFYLAVYFFLGTFRLMGMGDLKLIMALTALRGFNEGFFTFGSGIWLLLLYCLFDDWDNTILMIKDTFYFFTIHTPLVKRSKKKYPLATFMMIAYPIVLAWEIIVVW